MTARQVEWLVYTGRWRRHARNVYAINGAPTSWHQSALAGCLAGPDGTSASHLTAAALAGIARAPMLPHVTVPRGTSARLHIACVHRSDLAPCDTTRLFGIPATTVPRTIVDCAGALQRSALTDLVDTAFDRRLASVEAVQGALERANP